MLWRTKPDAGIDALRAENARLFAELAAVERRFRRIGQRMWAVQEDERRRLARELHDQLGQVLTALIHRLEQPGGDARAAAMELARHALADVRKLSRLLRPPVLDDLGLAAALNWLGRSTREDTGLSVSVAADDLDVRDPAVETMLFRVAQEAVTNAVKHAAARRVVITFARAGDRAELRVRDDGSGFEPATVERGLGLAGMRDRVAVHGGALAVASSPGRGTTVTVAVPLAPA